MKTVQEPARRGCRRGVLNGGDTGQSGPATASDVEYSPWGRKDVGVRLVRAMNTLLGPEETSAACLFGASPVVAAIRRLLGWSSWRRGGGWLLFENCTVDASIFVVKLPRANGGCLGTRSR